MSYRRRGLNPDSSHYRWSSYGDTPHVPRRVETTPSSFVPAPYSHHLTAPSRIRAPTTPIPKYNPWYTAYTPYYPTYYRGYSHMITSCKDYLNPGFMEPDRDREEATRVDRHKELQQQEEDRKKLINETKSHYSSLLGEVPQIGVHKDSRRTDYGSLARYLTTYGAKDTTNLLRFLESGCTKEPVAVEVEVDTPDDDEEDEDEIDGRRWIKAPLKHNFVKAGAPPPFLRNDSLATPEMAASAAAAAAAKESAKKEAAAVPASRATAPPETKPFDAAAGADSAASSSTTPEIKSERRPFRYAAKGGGGGGGAAAAAAGVGGKKMPGQKVKLPKKRETETIYIIPETLPAEVLAKERIRRDTDFLMAGLVL